MKLFYFQIIKDNGDLETLLLQIKNNTKYNNFFECYSEYIKCIKINTEVNYIDELLEDKNKVFSYFTSYYGTDKAKEENREYTLEYWDFNSDSLKPLKNFIEKNIV